MSGVKIQLFSTHAIIPESSRRTQEILVRSRDPACTKLSAMWRMMTFIALSVLNCLAYLASAVVGGLFVRRSIEYFQQQNVNAYRSFVCCVFGTCLLAKITFQGVVRAQESEVKSQQQFHAKLTEELKTILKDKFRAEFQSRYQVRLQECMLSLFPNLPHQKWLQDQLQEWLQPITEFSNILYGDSEGRSPYAEGSLCDSVRSLFLRGYQEREREIIRDLFIEWVEWRCLTILQDGLSSDLCQVISRDLSGDLRRDVRCLIPRNPYWNDAGHYETLRKYLRVALLPGGDLFGKFSGDMCRDLLLDSVPGQLQSMKEQLEQLTPETAEKESLRNMGTNLCYKVCQKTFERLATDVSADRGEERRLEALRHAFKDCATPCVKLLISTNHNSLYSALKTHFTQKHAEIQSEFQPLFEARLLGMIKVAFPVTQKEQGRLLVRLQDMFQALGSDSELHTIFPSPPCSGHYGKWPYLYWSQPFFQKLRSQYDKEVCQGVFFHQLRERLFLLLQGRVQDLYQVGLWDRSVRQLRVVDWDRGVRTPLQISCTWKLDAIAQDVVLSEDFALRECCAKDVFLGLLPKLLKDKQDKFLELIADKSSEARLLELQQELKEALREEWRQRALADYNQVGHVVVKDPLSRQLEKILEKAFSKLRSDSCSQSPSSPPQGG